MLRCGLVLAFLLPGAGSGWRGPAPTGFTFLKLGVGARPVAMGGAFTAVADDANALFWNPAGLGMSPGFAAGATFMKMLRTVSYTSAGVVAPLGPRVGVGVAGSWLSATDTRRSRLGEELGAFGLTDVAVGPGFGWHPVRGFALGAATQFVFSRIDTFSAAAFTIDAGALYRPLRFLTLGASLLHLGWPRRFIELWEQPPANPRAGAAFNFDFGSSRLLLASDVSAFPDYGPTVSAGGEYVLRLSAADTAGGQSMALRAGYQTGFDAGIWSGFSFGFGYERAMSDWLVLNMDAVYLSYGLLGSAERVSLSLRFSPRR